MLMRPLCLAITSLGCVLSFTTVAAASFQCDGRHCRHEKRPIQDNVGGDDIFSRPSTSTPTPGPSQLNSIPSQPGGTTLLPTSLVPSVVTTSTNTPTVMLTESITEAPSRITMSPASVTVAPSHLPSLSPSTAHTTSADTQSPSLIPVAVSTSPSLSPSITALSTMTESPTGTSFSTLPTETALSNQPFSMIQSDLPSFQPTNNETTDASSNCKVTADGSFGNVVATTPIEMDFFYQVVTLPGMDNVDGDVQQTIELAIVQHLLPLVDSCSNASGRKLQQQQQQQQIFLSGISALPPDVILDDVDCPLPSGLEDCHVLDAGMMLYLSESVQQDAGDIIPTMVKDIVRFAMADGTFDDVDESVVTVRYVDESSITNDGDDQDDDSTDAPPIPLNSERGEGRMPAWGWGLALLGGLLLIITTCACPCFGGDDEESAQIESSRATDAQQQQPFIMAPNNNNNNSVTSEGEPLAQNDPLRHASFTLPSQQSPSFYALDQLTEPGGVTFS